ncbi:MATE family efflux transporter [Oscillibacter sp. 1-3]|uniref:MATE family efflux transporter n=1 Tax=Oscillibacter sp. 1-3 TaxID=1235797 RepID=UPI00033FA427|nr:MATE family efflux transporter [Oscillibacter sp. 1-3]EOS63644.1 MATE efflux family protein [Oscillibacter sp. 1-3]
MKRNGSFIEGPILNPLLRFTFPVLLALLLQAMYGAVDLMVVGQFGQPADVSAVSTGSQVMHTVTALVTGLSMGATVLLGQKLGEGKPEEGGKVLGSAIALFAAVALVLTAAMLWAASPLARLMQAPAEAFAQTVLYVRICSGGAVFIVAYNVLGAMFRGLGDSNTPLLTVTIACATNIAGDLLLVGPCGLGVAGAALATVLAQAVSVALSLLFIKRRGLPFSFSTRDIRFDPRHTGRILRLGVPVALQDVLVSVSFLAIAAIVNGLGVIASAGVGVAEKLCGFIMLVPSSFGQSLSAFVAQNIGAGRKDRAKRAMLYGMGSSLCCGVVLAWLSFFHGSLLAGLFARDAAVIGAAADYLRAYAIDTLLTAILFCFIGYFNGRGNTAFVMVQGIVGAFLVRIPVSLFMSRLEPVSLFQVGLATPCSTVVQIVLFLGCYAGTAVRDWKAELAEIE